MENTPVHIHSLDINRCLSHGGMHLLIATEAKALGREQRPEFFLKSPSIRQSSPKPSSMRNIEYLNKFIDTTIEHLQQIHKRGIKKELSFIIKCSELEDFSYVDIRKSEKFKPILDQLIHVRGPVLYWFEIVSDVDTRKLIEELNRYKSGKLKSTPALKNVIDYGSKILYVGKVKGGF